ncbi:MAG: hypothetical protein EYC68_01900 [Chloroflexota bacterium]|nr:MAG: hypothetical protein EYC68_01900 [Chloroflexota bacterium]
MKSIRVISFLALAVVTVTLFAAPLAAQKRAQGSQYKIFLPLLDTTGCETIAGETYSALTVNPPPTDRPAEQHADLNLALRGYVATTGTLGLVDYGGSADGKAPKLYSLFGDNRVPDLSSVAQVYAWDWATNSRANPITDPPVTLAGMRVTPNEILRVPRSEYNIGTIPSIPPRGVFRDGPEDDGSKFEVLVLYASEQRITLKYTREDNVVNGYTIHVENVCTAPELLSLYRDWNQSGRAQLPALKQGQGFGRALGNEIGVVIRDNGSFMDPRSKKDWW